jgi:hypothetical protein
MTSTFEGAGDYRGAVRQVGAGILGVNRRLGAW